MQFRSRSSLGRRPGSVLWLVLALFLHGLVATHHATAMAAGVEVCSAGGGTHRVDADGRPTTTAGVHDCCCAGLDAAPPTRPPALPTLAPEVVAPVAPIRAAPGSRTPAPLPRGPPTFLLPN